ncbi:MAG TPA: DUF1697 domain-containing protein [Allosphingosinicella sp.]|jgi:uncharacterized protein (DUF1697 family)
MSRFVALLRAVNVAAQRKLPMAELRALCAEIGWENIQTYIQSGNIVFSASGAGGTLEAALEKAIEARFGFPVDAMVRGAAKWDSLVAANPFPAECETEPNRVLVYIAKGATDPGALAAFEARAVHGERVRQAGEALWIHYPEGAGAKTKLTTPFVDRAAGSPVTARNWRTVVKLQEMLEA